MRCNLAILVLAASANMVAAAPGPREDDVAERVKWDDKTMEAA
jgi:hypothetical protein